ncbi:hypothetical protein KTO58_14610 [Chitinophaga pendula]|uniref:hypothetical protein n=1 Tax=Chitinophaga TaxID=79328 RepID=UPI000BAF74FC|nr:MULTISPECIES: hypothetical protein [Chitinophaga]ASZ12035.1 hypothetical protein CK934_14225 [Chitinophaga sp. MD30]UCJ04932.1 hypothetical protein KTO58_14610 [Chitinophaga pendula]
MRIKETVVLLCVLAVTVMSACNSGKANKHLMHKKWKVYDVQVPKEDGYNITQVNQATELKRGYYSDAYYQFLENNLFIATVAGKADSGRYELLSNGEVISVTAANGGRSSEHLVTITRLDDTHFDMKVLSGDYHFILMTKAE